MREAPPPLEAGDAARLIEFARACKAAARAVALYPAAHPAIATTLGRVADLTSSTHAPAALRITVLPESLLLDGRALERVDQATVELAALLHNHRVGELTIHPDAAPEAWLGFLLLLARPPEAVRDEGGIGRLWMAQGRPHVELRELDYAEVLRERAGGGLVDGANKLNEPLLVPRDFHERAQGLLVDV